jgi:hypothetical protein
MAGAAAEMSTAVIDASPNRQASLLRRQICRHDDPVATNRADIKL